MKSTFFHRLFSCWSACFFLSGLLYAQPVTHGLNLTDGSNFHTIQKDVNEFFEKNPGIRGYKQWKRREWFLEPRLYPSGKMENLTMKTFVEYQRYMSTLPASRSTHGSWLFLGPSTNPTGQGRLNAIAFHPTNANIMYVGSSNGGVWKTIDGGASWSNITPHIPLISIADIKISPTNSNVIFILTGDGDPQPPESNSHGQTEVSSIGILRSPDAGVSWYPTGFSFDHPSVVVPTKLLIHPTNDDIQFVVCTQGIYRTTSEWEDDSLQYSGLVYDIEFKPGDPTIMYASGPNRILKSTDTGDLWPQVSDADFSFATATRIELAVAPNNASIVYALVGNWAGGFIQLLQSASSGSSNSWTVQNNTATTFGAYAEYCIGLVVDPLDYTDVFGGLQWINRSLDQGVGWASIQGIVHADIHDVAYTNGALWVCCDGGLFKSIDEGNSWTNLTNGMAITEIYRITGTAQNNNLYFIGCQDNGTMRRNGSTSNFDDAWGGDGTTPLISYENSNLIYAGQQGGVFGKSLTGGNPGSFTNLNVPGGTSSWITPIVMDPADPDTLFIGKRNVIRTKNAGTTWDSIGIPTGVNLNCLAQGVNNRNYLYASSDTWIFKTTNALLASGYATWINIGGEVPNLFITGIAVNPADALNVYVSLSGYNDGEKVYRSTNGGTDWESISGSLPNVPVNCIVYDENGSGGDALYIGTDIGVFYRDNALGDWVYFSNPLQPVNISDLYINDGDNTIVAGTYGRGLWRSSKYTGCESSITLVNIPGSPAGGVKYFSSSGTITSNVEYKTELGTEIHYKASNYVALQNDFLAGGLAFFEAKTGTCPDIVSDPLVSPFVSSSIFVMGPHGNKKMIWDEVK